MDGIYSQPQHSSPMSAKTNDHLLARAYVACTALKSHQRDLIKQINGRVRCLNNAIDAIAEHDLNGTKLEGVDALSEDVLHLVDNPTQGL